jgi:hypothetical protein
MSAISRLPQSDPLYARPAPERPVYATGVLLDADDFSAEQTYHRGRLAQAMAFLSGGGTLAGLRVSYGPEADGHAEEIRVAAGLACDRLGRLVELPRPACLRLSRWWDTIHGDDGDRLRTAAYADPGRFVSERCAGEAGTLPDRAVVADVFIRFIACERGYTPSFASGPYDALDAVATSRLRDAYELLLVPRDGLDDDFDGLPVPAFQVADDATAQARRDAMHDALLGAWPEAGDSGSDGTLAPAAEHPVGVDPTAQFLARVLLPVLAGDPPGRTDAAVVVDNWSRRFVPSSQLLQRWLAP